MTEPQGAPDVPPSGGQMLDFYRQMCLIRRFEETLLEMFSEGLLVGTTHTCIGQEANAVGVLSHVDADLDVVVSNHRCHGHYIAFTGDVSGLIAEVMGRVTGTCGGRGGSQHLCRGNFYTNGVQGSIAPLATGIALAERERGAGALTTVFLGDGTLGQGAVYECLNMASLWSLPLLIVVENNRYAQTTPSELAVSGSVAARAEAFGIETAELDTTDVVQVHAAAGAAASSVRRSGRPYFLVLNTHRMAPHSKGDDTRHPDELEALREHDPLRVLGARLERSDRARIERECREEIAAAREAGEEAPAAGAALAR